MNDREYLMKIVEALPEEKLGAAISYFMSIPDDGFDGEKFGLAKEYILEKYRAAFEELAK